MVSTYNGSEPYIFVSYAHKDSEDVFSTIEQLVSLGYRVWFDEGIRPGMEWAENIAVHLDRCSLFMMFISKNSMESANCRREINFALSRSKPFLCIVLEDTEIPLGMELQLASQQSIFKYHYTSEKEYMIKVCSAAGMAECKNTHYFAESRPELARMDSHLSTSAGRRPRTEPVAKPQTAEFVGVQSEGTAKTQTAETMRVQSEGTAKSQTTEVTKTKPVNQGKKDKGTGSSRRKKKRGFGHFILLLCLLAAALLILFLLIRTMPGGSSAGTPTVTPTVSADENTGGDTTEPYENYEEDNQDGEAEGNYPGEDTAEDNQTTVTGDENEGYAEETQPDNGAGELQGQGDTGI